jgi:hypothetical protein
MEKKDKSKVNEIYLSDDEKEYVIGFNRRFVQFANSPGDIMELDRRYHKTKERLRNKEYYSSNKEKVKGKARLCHGKWIKNGDNSKRENWHRFIKGNIDFVNGLLFVNDEYLIQNYNNVTLKDLLTLKKVVVNSKTFYKVPDFVVGSLTNDELKELVVGVKMRKKKINVEPICVFREEKKDRFNSGDRYEPRLIKKPRSKLKSELTIDQMTVLRKKKNLEAIDKYMGIKRKKVRSDSDGVFIGIFKGDDKKSVEELNRESAERIRLEDEEYEREREKRKKEV